MNQINGIKWIKSNDNLNYNIEWNMKNEIWNMEHRKWNKKYKSDVMWWCDLISTLMLWNQKWHSIPKWTFCNAFITNLYFSCPFHSPRQFNLWTNESNFWVLNFLIILNLAPQSLIKLKIKWTYFLWAN